MADDPTIYACVSSVTDPSQAAPGTENWFLLVNAPPGIRVDGSTQQRHVLDVLARRGIELRDRADWSEVITPLQLAARTRAPGGAIYGTSSDGRRAAFVRPRNRGARDGLFLVGASSHPGGGLPLVLTGARIVAGMIG
jgi:phytoene dehydrogenase-like protein